MKRISLIAAATLVSTFFVIGSCSSVAKRTSGSDQDPNFKDGIYVNNHTKHPNKTFWAFLKLRFFGDDEWADHTKAADLIPKTTIDLPLIKSQTQQVTWLGHSTFLIQLNGLNILTDPIVSERSSPVSFGGPKRYTQVATDISSLPKIDVVIISHNHYDHLDKASIEQLGSEPVYYVPSGLSPWFEDVGVEKSKVRELRWWQSVTSGDFKITATPSQHWSARGLGDRFRTHWASWLVENGDTQFWFAGDTGYNDKDFVAIGEHIKKHNKILDFALIPIGAYAPRHFMKTYHVNTEEAVQIHKDVGSRFSIGMHWGAFPLTAEWPMEPYEKLNAIRAENGLGDYPFETMKIGETVAIN